MRVINLESASGGMNGMSTIADRATARVEGLNVNGKKLLFNPDNLGACVLEGDEKPDLEVVKQQIPCLFDCRRPQFPSSNVGVQNLVLNVTHSCNLACEYCFVRNYAEDQAQHMTFQIAARALTLLDHRAPIKVSFFGGEPMLNFDVVKDTVALARDMARQRGVNCHFHMTTNATLFDEESVSYLDGNGFSLIVSLDGDVEAHNAVRPMRNEKDSHAATMQGLELLKGKDIAKRTTLRSTFTGKGVNLAKRLSYLNHVCSGMHMASHVSVEPVSLAEHGCIHLPDGHDHAITMDNVEQFAPEYEAAAKWFVLRARQGNVPRFHHFMKPLERILYRTPAGSECGGGKGYLAIGPDGALFACHREGKSRVGHLNTGMDEALRAKWLDNRIYARRGCTECWARHVCGGGCRLDSLDHCGDITQPHEVGCWFKRTMAKWCLWIAAELEPEKLREIIPCPRGRK